MASTPDHGKPFSKMVGFATPNGSMFEVNMAALLFLRGLNSGLDFHLATNVDGAGALDDIVYRVSNADGTSNTYFVQLKHKETPGTPENPSGSIRKMLIDSKGKKSPLHSYFKAFSVIKRSVATLSDGEKPFYLDGINIDDCIFVLYTNAVFEDVLSDDRSKLLSFFENATRFLASGSGIIFDFHPNGTSDVEKDVLRCLSVNEDPKKNEEYALENVPTFLGQFFVFCGQSGVGNLNNFIKFELAKVKDSRVRGVDVNRLCESFVHEMKEWWEKSCYTLHKTSVILDKARARIEVEDRSVLEKGRYFMNALCFKESALSMFAESIIRKFSLVVVEASEGSFRLSYTKFHRATSDSHLLFSIQGLLSNKDGVISEIEGGRVRRLVVCAADLKPDSDSCLCLVEVCAQLETYNGQVVVFANDTEMLFDKLKEKFLLSERIEDTFNFSQLTKDSQNVILEKEFLHQNCKTSVLKLLGNDPNNTCYIDAVTVLQMVDWKEDFLDAPALAESIDYFVDRVLEQTNVVNESYLKLNPVQGRNLVENSSMQHVQSIFLDGDESLERSAHETIQTHFQSCVYPGRKSDSSLFFGPLFTIGKFKCNFICVGRSIALQMRSTESGYGSNLFLIKVTNKQDAHELSKCHNSLHFFSLQGGVLYWIKSDTSNNVLPKHLHRTVSITPCSQVVQKTDKEQGYDTGKIIANRRLEIVCGEPGMGKSTLMTHLALETKARFPDSWIILLSLNDHTDLFDDRQLYKDAIKYLLAAVFQSQFGLSHTLFRIALQNTENVVVILDGYDEIAPRYVPQCRELIQSICKTKVKQILVTTRNSMQADLEDFLMTFAIKLREFDEQDQRRFLKLYWRVSREKAHSAGTNILSEEELDAFITFLLTKTTQAISDQQKEFMSIPLQAQMVGEVFEDYVISESREHFDPDEKLDVLNLLNKFVEKKLHVYLQGRLKVKPTDTNYKSHVKPHRRDFERNHSMAALVLILGQEDVELLHSKDIAKKSGKFLESIVDGRDKTGFIDRVVNGKPRFIHRVYAEYFVAKWFEKHYAKNAEFLQKHLYTENFKVIREIFDLLLARGCQSKLHLAVIKANVAQVQDLIQAGATLEETDGGGRTALHLAATLHSTIRKDYEDIKKDDADTILNFLLSGTEVFNLEDNVFNGSPLQYASVTRSWYAMDMIIRHTPDEAWQDGWDFENKEMLKTVCEKDMANLLQACLNQGLSVDHCIEYLSESNAIQSLLLCSCKAGSLKVSRLLINSGANMRVVNAQGETSLHLAAKSRNAQTIRLLINEYRETLHNDCKARTTEAPVRFISETERAQFISAVDNDGNSALHIWSARLRGFSSEEILELATESLDVVKLLVTAGASLTQENNLKQTPLMFAATNYHANIVEFMLKNLEVHRVGPGDELVPVNTKQDGLDYINKRDASGLSALQHAIVKMRSDEVIPCLIKHGADVRSADKNGRTALISAILSHRGDKVVTDLLNAVDGDKADFVNMRDAEGNTAIHYSISEYQREVFLFLVEAGGNFLQENGVGETPLRLAVKRNFAEVIEDIFRFFNEKQDTKTIGENESLVSEKSAHINTKDEKGFTVLSQAALRGNAKIVSCLIKHGADVRVINENGFTPLQVVINTGISHDSVIIALLDALDEKSRADYVNSRSPDGSTALHNVCSLDIIMILLKAGGDLSLPDSDGHNPFMIQAMGGPYSETVDFMLKHLVDKGVTGYMEARNNEGLTVLHLAAYNGYAETVRVLLTDEDADIWSPDGDFGGTPLHWAGKTNSDVVKVLLDACESKRREYVNFGDASGDTALHWAVEDGNLDSVRVLVEAGAEVTLANKDGVTPLAAAAESVDSNIWYFLNNLVND